MKYFRKTLSLLLTVCLILSVVCIGGVQTVSATEYETYARDTVQGSAILRCFNFISALCKFNNTIDITSKMLIFVTF